MAASPFPDLYTRGFLHLNARGPALPKTGGDRSRSRIIYEAGMRQPTFLLFRNIHRRGPSDPEYVGSITAGGVNYRIEAEAVLATDKRMAHFAGRVKRTSYAPGRRNGRQADFDEPLGGAAPEFDDPIPR